MDREILIKTLVESWPSNIVPRTKFYEFSQGAFRPGTLANKDSQGCGPRGRMFLGKGIFYPVADAAEWVADQLKSTADIG